MSDIGDKRNICALNQISEVKKSKTNIQRPSDACEMARDVVLQSARYKDMSSLFNSTTPKSSTVHYDAKAIPMSLFKVGQEYITNHFYFFITEFLNAELNDLV